MKSTRSNYNALIDSFVLELPDTQSRRLTIGWILLSLGALVIGGLFTILIVLSRTPYFQEIIPWADFFHTAIVVHVDLTVLVWFLGFAGVLWSLNQKSTCLKCSWLALGLAVLGTVVITAAPFFGAGEPLMNNYVPVLQHPLFLTGLGIFGLGFTLQVLNGLFLSNRVGSTISGDGALRFGLYTAMLAAVVSIAMLVLSYFDMPEFAETTYYYELLFWDAGHTLQFMHVQLMLVSWLWLSSVSGINLKISPRVVLFIFVIGLVPVILTPFIYSMYDLGEAMHKQAVSYLMMYGGGLAALPIGLIVVLGILQKKQREIVARPEFNALVSSVLLFGVGGAIGFMINGSNVTVPAHYHGSIVAITLIYMGVTYHILPRLGFRPIAGKAVRWQPVLYASGQLMHIFGLVWSGGYGVQRKTAGIEQGADHLERVIGMGVMGLGGLIAIIGGIMFLVIAFKSMWPQK
ncbi:MAG: cbb3-type cytochrome c oxidase subunit I [Gammaproteobacteria bacterium]|nr:cbb3-type cytochrome c oxidase subunit I [Gammaproteobacteria bacterium]MCW8986904.1 cbb3-type cytochrome c oxidase subunit I [Gammaproteobacteria bacterium]MCW9030768.1 cbb3-type cytochrome c oxidase subunit I [Gammaproteobacteria bacterium]